MPRKKRPRLQSSISEHLPKRAETPQVTRTCGWPDANHVGTESAFARHEGGIAQKQQDVDSLLRNYNKLRPEKVGFWSEGGLGHQASTTA